MNVTRRNSNGTSNSKKDLLTPGLNRALMIGDSTNLQLKTQGNSYLLKALWLVTSSKSHKLRDLV
jgi:hypothetical protein